MGEVHLPGVAIALFVVAADQITKYLVTGPFLGNLPLDVVRGVFTINLVRNTGGAFSIMRGHAFFFVAVSVISIAVLVSLLFEKDAPAVTGRANAGRYARLAKIGFALMLGGALGNLADRVRLGCVIDFLDFHVWPVFNVADSAITIGMLLIVISFFTGRRPSDKA